MTFVLVGRRADGRGAGGRPGRDRQRHAAQRLPLDPPAGRPDRAGRGDGPRAADLPARAVRVGAAPAGAARRRRPHADQVVHIEDGLVRVETPTAPRRGDPRPDRALGGGRARVVVRAQGGGRDRRRDGPQRPDPRARRTSRSPGTRRSSSSATRRSSRGSRTGRRRGSRRAASRAARTRPRPILARLHGDAVKPYRYSNHGDVAVIGRLRGVTDIPWMGPFGQQSGFTAWLLWLLIHITYLIGFANRIVVMTRWAFSFLTRGRSTRLITGQPLVPPIEYADRRSSMAQPAARARSRTSAARSAAAASPMAAGRRRARAGGRAGLGPAAAVRGDDPGQALDRRARSRPPRSRRSRRSGRPARARSAAPPRLPERDPGLGRGLVDDARLVDVVGQPGEDVEARRRHRPAGGRGGGGRGRAAARRGGRGRSGASGAGGGRARRARGRRRTRAGRAPPSPCRRPAWPRSALRSSPAATISQPRRRPGCEDLARGARVHHDGRGYRPWIAPIGSRS